MPLRRLLPLLFFFFFLLRPAASAAATCPYDIPYASRLIPPQCYLNATKSSTPTGCCWSVFAAYIYSAIRYANVSGAAFLPDAVATACSTAFSAYLLRERLVPASLLLTGERCNLVGDPVKFAAGTRPCQFPTVAAVRDTVDLSAGTRLCTFRRGNLTDDQPACVACQNAVIAATFALLDATQSKEIVACGMAATMGIWSVSPPDVGRFSSYSLCMLQILENVGNLGTGSILPFPSPPRATPSSSVSSRTHYSRMPRAAKIATWVTSAALALVGAVSCLVFLWIRWRRRSQLAAITTDDQYRENNTDEMIGSSPLPTDGLYIFTKNELRQATDGFDAKHLLGEGGAGKVYLGKLPSGQQVAIKRVQKKKKVGEFYREVEVLAKLRHRSLTTLVGYCLQDREHALVYEYMPGGNLSCALQYHGVDLTWSRRVRIAADVAEGLAYLHDLPDGAVVHRDVKPTNVLLGDDLIRAKLSDFGVSTVLPSTEEITHVSTEVKGTRGYVDPEYFSAGQVCESADVYSFGVVLLQLIKGLKAVVPTASGGLESIVQTAHDVVAAPSHFGEFFSISLSVLAPGIPPAATPKDPTLRFVFFRAGRKKLGGRRRGGREDGAPEQQPGGHPQLPHLPAVDPHPRRRHMAQPPRRHRLRALPREARDCAGGLPPGGVPRRPRGRLLPGDLVALGVSPRHVRPHRPRVLLHRLRLRRHQQGCRRGGVQQGVQGVQAWGLLQLAAEEG